MKHVLENLHTIEGVQGSLVVDGNGQILAYQAHALYDIDLLTQVSKGIIATVDAVRLLHEDWDALSANFSEGNLILRNLKPGGAAAGSTVVLALIADARLNPAFAGVAIRVAAAKLKTRLESLHAGSDLGTSQNLPSITTGGGQSGSIPAATGRSGQGMPDVGSSGISWAGSSTGLASEVSVADPRTSAFLTACTKALAASVGPMAKIFVKEAVRQLCPDRPFSRAQAEALIPLLSKHIDDPAAITDFQKKVRSFV
jgi:predicted regulator of Ras-like GTPase activity (Roadblock/LC7/MglB family)